MHDEAELFRQVDRDAQRFQLARDEARLVLVADGFERLQVERFGGVRALRFFRGVDEPLDGAAAQLLHGIVDERRLQRVGLRGIGALQQVERELPARVGVLGLLEEGADFGERQRLLRAQGVGDDGVAGEAQPVVGDGRAGADGGEQRRKNRGAGADDLLPGGARGFVALAFAADGVEGFQGVFDARVERERGREENGPDGPDGPMT